MKCFECEHYFKETCKGNRLKVMVRNECAKQTNKYTEAQAVLFDIYENVLDFKDTITSKAFENADKALEIADRLEQADAQIIADNFCDEVCNSNKCQEGVRCDYARMTKLLAEKILADLRGDAE